MSWLALEMSQLTPRDLRVGGRYLHKSGQHVRVIDGIRGGSVIYHDESAPIQCPKKDFLETVVMEAPGQLESSSEIVNRVFGGEIKASELAQWHDSLKTQCALVNHHARWLRASLVNYESQILGTIGFDAWRGVENYLDGILQASGNLQATLEGIGAN